MTGENGCEPQGNPGDGYGGVEMMHKISAR